MKIKESKIKQYPEGYNINSVIYFATEELKSFEDYSKRMEDFMFEENVRYNQYLDDKFLEYNIRFEGRQDLGFYFKYHYPDLFRKSLIINIFTHIEKTLNKICVFYEEKNKEKFCFLDMNGRSIDRAKEYLTKTIGLDVSEIKVWEKLKILQKVRNQIVHNNSELQLDKLKEWEKIKQEFNGLIIAQYERFFILRIRKSFVSDFNKHTQKFLKELKDLLVLNENNI